MPEQDEKRDYRGAEARRSAVQRRRDRIVAEIERNRRGEYWLPTWAMVAILLAIIAGWASLVIFA
ncbi:hypothetical protein [Rugosimonospora africana]|nr:hypothetical protein [Rugosimonospora africana]